MAILLMLSKLGLRADEVATLTLDDIDWRAGEMLVRSKGRQRSRIPIASDVGAGIAPTCGTADPSPPVVNNFSVALHPTPDLPPQAQSR